MEASVVGGAAQPAELPQLAPLRSGREQIERWEAREHAQGSQDRDFLVMAAPADGW